ncbi:MAG TPA: hypothetical protein VKI65_07915 [Gemmataceae bacterium]|nr:hypothetical protein [Gemmataceae bacterium]
MNDMLLSRPIHPPVLFQRLRWRLFRNALAALRERSVLRIFIIGFLCLLIWGLIFVGNWEGFRFLQRLSFYQQLPYLDAIVGTIFDLLFLALAFMLVFSGSIILYSSLFASAETAFLLGTPMPADQVFAYKYQGAIAFSSWAFILLGSPLLVAYGVVFDVPWQFYALLPLFFLGFLLLPGSLAALLCLIVVNWMPQRRRQVLWIAGLTVAGLAALGLMWLVQGAPLETWTRDDARNQLGRLAFARSVLLPTHWMSQGLQAAGRGDLREAGYRLSLVWSNGLLLYLLTAWLAARCYRRGYNRLSTGGDLRRRYGGAWLDRLLSSLGAPLDPQTRLLIIKDFRTFRRDPAQWAQILIFTGLLTLSFASIRLWLSPDGLGRSWGHGVSLISLAATALMLCAATGRFIYPMLSLEGRKFWILGLLPLQRERLLWGKFGFSAIGALLVAEFIVVCNDFTLSMTGLAIGLHTLTVAVLALGLSGLSVGLGACMPNFRETDPSKIAVGFGGTLNLIAGLLFLAIVIAVMAAPYHVYAAYTGDADLQENPNVGWLIGDDTLGLPMFTWLIVGVGLGLLVGIVAVIVPLRIGIHALRRMEF